MLKISIGIPSYNEGARIISLIRSVFESTLNSKARISEVIICDHSSDATPKILKSFVSQHPHLPIYLVHHDERGGAASAWNEIFSVATGDIIVLFDADVLPLKECVSELLSCMESNRIGLCASNPICFKPDSSTARAASFISNWLAVIRSRGISQYTVMGRSLSIRADLAKRIIIPKETIAIDLYLQCKILEMGYHILYRKKAMVYFTPPSNMRDFTSQVLRSRNGHKQISTLVRRLGINASLWSVLIASIKTAYGNPTGAIFMLLCSCLLPFYGWRLPGTNSYKWTIATSTKAQAR
jgi:cellulose synthase/poly-beta-1,6-N-acetylglucosamine synthase-like glycosyltransferase